MEENKDIKTLGDEASESTQVFSDVNLLNVDNDLIKTKSFKHKGTFVIKLPNNLLKIDIGRRIANYFNIPVNNISDQDYMFARAMITVDVIIEKAPDWWEGAIKCYDQNLILKIFNWYLKEEKDLNEKLKKNKVGRIHQTELE